jgi:hypothetical protein
LLIARDPVAQALVVAFSFFRVDSMTAVSPWNCSLFGRLVFATMGDSCGFEMTSDGLDGCTVMSGWLGRERIRTDALGAALGPSSHPGRV